MDIPPFPRKAEIPDLEYFLRACLSNTVVMWPDQAIPLLGYMCHPNDEAARNTLMGILRSWPDHAGPRQPPVPKKLPRIHADWLKVADIFHHYCDLIGGEHQKRRGGPSIGKAVDLVAAKASSRGAGKANLWKRWETYKDVAHLVTAAALIRKEARKRSRHWSLGPSGLSMTQIIPFQMAMLMPDFVLAVAADFERYSLARPSKAGTGSGPDADTLWRIPPDINVVPFPALIRKLGQVDKAVLDSRRAGNRGRVKPKTE
jgi:hypothetical protein